MKKTILIILSILTVTMLFCMKGPSVVDPGNGHSTTENAIPVLLNDTTFSDSVTANGRVGMVDFYLSTCSHCIAMMPLVDTLADSIGSVALIAKVNAAENDSLSSVFGISAVPTFIFFRNGVEYDRIIGECTIAEMAGKIQTGLNGAPGKRLAITLPDR